MYNPEHYVFLSSVWSEMAEYWIILIDQSRFAEH